MTPLRPELLAWLGRVFPGAAVEPMTGDASTRRFLRLRLAGGASRVLMDYGKPFEGETGDIRATRLFEAARLPVARILDSAPDPGCLILEDLGEVTLEQFLESASPEERRRLYQSAVDLAVAIATEGTREIERSEETWPALDAERFRFEMDFFLEHYAGDLVGLDSPPTGLRESLHGLAERAAVTPRRLLCHRDYHSRNLLVRRDGSLAMVDIQDARWGPDTYDLASLLRDAYVDLDEEEAAGLIERFALGAGPGMGPETLRARFDVMAAQRMIKALGTFGYQVAVLGRDRYRSAIARTVGRLRRLLPLSRGTASLAGVLERAGLL